MKRQFLGVAAVIALCLSGPFAFGERGNEGAAQKKGGEKPGKGSEPQNRGGEKTEGKSQEKGKPPGGAWSEGKPSPGKHSASNDSREAEGKKKSPEGTGAEGAAAGAAAANRNKPAATGAEGAAAGAAAADRNKPAATGAEGAAAGAAAAKKNQPAVSAAEGAAVGSAINRNQTPAGTGAAASYSAVRNSFDHPTLYNQQWHSNHPNAWTASNWSSGAAWTATTMAGVAAYCGYGNLTPVSYGYGNNVIYRNGNVIVDGRNVGTGEVYSQQAADLAMIGQNADTADTDEWLPLGVFALVRNADQHAQLTLQFAINKQGILRGNYTDTVTDHEQAIHGAVEKETQRAAWTVDNNQNFYMEAGMSNLTSGEAPTLIHKYGKTEKWMLVRLPKPEETE